MRKKDNKRQGEAGFVVTLELLFISVILVIGLVVGLVTVRDAMITELADLSEAIGVINQSYTYDGVSNSLTAAVLGSQMQDEPEIGTEFIDTQLGDSTLAEFIWAPPPAPFNEGQVLP